MSTRLHTDWMYLPDGVFKSSCDELGVAISCELKTGFRNRLRGRTQGQPAPAPAVVVAQSAPPPPQYTVSTVSPHPSTGWWPFAQPSYSQPLAQPSYSQAGSEWADVSMSAAPRSTTQMHGPVAPYDTCYGPPHSSEHSGSCCDVLPTEDVATTEPTAAAASARLAKSKSKSPASTAPKAAAAEVPPGKSHRVTSSARRVECASLFDRTPIVSPSSHLSQQRRAAFSCRASGGELCGAGDGGGDRGGHGGPFGRRDGGVRRAAVSALGGGDAGRLGHPREQMLAAVCQQRMQTLAQRAQSRPRQGESALPHASHTRTHTPIILRVPCMMLRVARLAFVCRLWTLPEPNSGPVKRLRAGATCDPSLSCAMLCVGTCIARCVRSLADYDFGVEVAILGNRRGWDSNPR